MKNIIKLSIISNVGDKNYAILIMKDFTIKGNNTNGYDFECGNCSKILATNASYEQIRNVILLCKCGKHNIVKLNWKDYIFKYIKEEINYVVVIIGFFLMFIVSTNANIPSEIKVFIDITIFFLSFYYKSLVQIFQEK